MYLEPYNFLLTHFDLRIMRSITIFLCILQKASNTLEPFNQHPVQALNR